MCIYKFTHSCMLPPFYPQCFDSPPPFSSSLSFSPGEQPPQIYLFFIIFPLKLRKKSK